MRSLPRLSGPPAGLLAASGLGLIAAVLAVGAALGGVPNTAVHPLPMAVLLVLVCFPLIHWAVGTDPTLRGIAYGGLAAKIAGTVIRYELTADASDAILYDRRGAQIARWLEQSMVWPNEARVQGGGHGTTNLSYAVGWMYHVLGARLVTAYVIWAFLGFVGLLLVFRAATVTIPQLDRRRYALLLFFLPSLLFWPASLGKDAWMVCALGIASTGVAAMVNHRWSATGFGSLVAGLLMAGWIRPHVAALATVALLATLVWPRRRGRNLLQQIVGLLVAFAVLLVALDQVAEFFGAERFEVAEVLERAENVTAEGDAEFTPTPITNPLSFFPGLVTVLFRPFPFEATTLLQLLTSFESLAVLGLALVGFGRLRTVPRAFANNGMIRFVVIYLLGFVIAFSVISNYGILARQRAQMWPFLLVLPSLQPSAAIGFRSRRKVKRHAAEGSGDEATSEPSGTCRSTSSEASSRSPG